MAPYRFTHSRRFFRSFGYLLLVGNHRSKGLRECPIPPISYVLTLPPSSFLIYFLDLFDHSSKRPHSRALYISNPLKKTITVHNSEQWTIKGKPS